MLRWLRTPSKNSSQSGSLKMFHFYRSQSENEEGRGGNSLAVMPKGNLFARVSLPVKRISLSNFDV